MLLMGRTPQLKANNFLNPLIQTYYDDENPIVVTTQMIANYDSSQECMEKFQKTFVKPKSNKIGHMLLGKANICFWGLRKERLLWR